MRQKKRIYKNTTEFSCTGALAIYLGHGFLYPVRLCWRQLTSPLLMVFNWLGMEGHFPWLEPVKPQFLLPLSLWVHMCVSPILSGKYLFSWNHSSPLALTIFLLPFPQSSLIPEVGEVWWRHPSHLGLGAPRYLSLSAYCPVVGHCVTSHLLPEEASQGCSRLYLQSFS